MGFLRTDKSKTPKTPGGPYQVTVYELSVPTRTRDRKACREMAGSHLRELRVQRGLSQRELAQKLGYKHHTLVAHVEAGHMKLPAEKLRAWADALAVPAADMARHLLRMYEPTWAALLRQEPSEKATL